jgi:hypothetical protein
MLAQTATHTESSRPAISTHRVSPVSDLAKQNPLIEAMHMMGATMSLIALSRGGLSVCVHHGYSVPS